MAASSTTEVLSDTIIVASREKLADTDHGIEPPDATFSNPRKRKRPEATSKCPNIKKAKEISMETPHEEDSASATRSPTPLVIDKNNWQGFCEIESEPAYFSVILREMGVENVTVREVLTMDPNYLEASLPQPIHGLILLFHYREFGNADQSPECPSNVWFANQLPAQNSCATLAMINILMNSAEVQIGEHLSQFKDFTRDLTPYQRGEALASFDFVKRIHNSFAKKMDILVSDKLLSYKVSRETRLRAQEEQDKQDKEAATISNKSNKRRGTTSTSTKSKSKSRRRASTVSVTTENSAEAHEETSHHFIAFVPTGTEVWKLDGLDHQPTSMGQFDPAKGETWLSAVSDTIASLMAAGDDDYGVVALTQSPLRALRERASVVYNTMVNIDDFLSGNNGGNTSQNTNTNTNNETANIWQTPYLTPHLRPCPSLLGLTPLLPLHPAPPLPSPDIAHATQLFHTLAAEMSTLAANIIAETQAEGEEETKAAQRRFDAAPVVKRWLEMLAENGHLERNLHRFMAGAGRGK
ncbi:hypothetical protein LEMA_P097750.1 [Plenodomus lingam JN3]|uniref:Ubiquitin carboxyl-terminal hydrolase n=2 Tax=Leptosphaeria maculans TaxID=5022 RepID=E5A421_LEPMJ|nr:hypothetical protein LEMA_P097750.1 [Plenodomus lingam JN3]CBX98366.1 hypothetical protein LEMA_P097750.1 [Plenodomus lingam JN3]